MALATFDNAGDQVDCSSNSFFINTELEYSVYDNSTIRKNVLPKIHQNL